MPIVLENNSITGAANISASGTTYGITQTTSGYVNFPYRPSFYAYGISGGTFAVGSYIISPTTEVNIGGHYNTSNGRFTAPITGLYQFHWSNIANTTSGVYRYYFRVNGINVGNSHLRQDNSPDGTAYGNNGAYCITCPLSVNDYAQVFYSAGPTSMYPGANSLTNEFINFSGWLIG
jgi:hypothetical protein